MKWIVALVVLCFVLSISAFASFKLATGAAPRSGYDVAYYKLDLQFLPDAKELQHVVGDELFFASMKSYLEDFRYGNCSASDFEHVVERNYGRPLHWFFDEWLNGTGRPTYSSKWRTVKHNGREFVEVHVSQVQDSVQVFKMPLDVEFDDAGGKRIETVMNEKKETDYEFPVTDVPTAITIDPGNWILKSSVSSNQVDR